MPDPDPGGLQHGGLPRQGRRPERVPPLALRVRPRRRSPGTHPRGARPSDRPAGAAASLLLGQGDRARLRTRAGRGSRPARPSIGRFWPGSRRALPRVAGKTHGALVKVAVEPADVRLDEPGPLQLRVVARYADGHERDVTRLASFRVNDDSTVSIDARGRAALLRRAETDLIVRYQSQVVSTRLATVINPDLKFDFAKLPRRNFIDDELFKRLEALKVPAQPAGGRRGVPPAGLARPDRRAAARPTRSASSSPTPTRRSGSSWSTA